MSNKGDSKKEMLERFEKMGIPLPMEPVKASATLTKNPELASKLDQIRNGGLKNNFSSFIEKSEKKNSLSSNLQIPKTNKEKSETSGKAPALEGFAAKKNTEASMLEGLLYEDSNPSSSAQASNFDRNNFEDFGPEKIDTKSLLQARLNQKQSQAVANNHNIHSSDSIGLTLTETELNERIAKVAKEISTKMIKSVLLEFSKSNGSIIMESKNVKKAEIVGKNRVKIGGVVYDLKPVDNE